MSKRVGRNGFKTRYLLLLSSLEGIRGINPAFDVGSRAHGASGTGHSLPLGPSAFAKYVVLRYVLLVKTLLGYIRGV